MPTKYRNPSYPQETFQQTTFLPPSSSSSSSSAAATFIPHRRRTVSRKTLLYQLDTLKKTGRYDAFNLKWQETYNDTPIVAGIPNHLFWDSDVAKWIEGACYFLLDAEHLGRGNNGSGGEEEGKDEGGSRSEIQGAVEELVGMISSAQGDDGYLNIHFSVVEPRAKRWSNLRDLHELYNAGHLTEGALAHEAYYKNNDMLAPICRYVDLIATIFGPGDEQIHGYPGHPEIELALLRLSHRTKKVEYAELARYFLAERGRERIQNGSVDSSVPEHYFTYENRCRGESVRDMPGFYDGIGNYSYQQAHKPIVEQDTIKGHSVRAMYLLTAVADLARLDELDRSAQEQQALRRLWDNMIDKKMSLTGGIGAMKNWEGFGIDYFLPQSTDEGGCYNETCASIGVMMLAERMLQIDLDEKYADIMELCLYNTVATAMSSCGTRFTYVNQLASSDADLSKRQEWFTCACCPPNLTRLFGYIGGYLWTSYVFDENCSLDINVHLYSSATMNIAVGSEHVKLTQSSKWPWDGDIKFHLQAPKNIKTILRLRIPSWSGDWQLHPAFTGAKVEKGYLVLPPIYLSENPKFRLTIPLRARLVSPHPYTNQEIVALARGPIIYCLEDVDNEWVTDHFRSLAFDTSAEIQETFIENADMGEPYVGLEVSDGAYFLNIEDGRLPMVKTSYARREDVKQLKFIPYALRDNRGGIGHMRVGMRTKR